MGRVNVQPFLQDVNRVGVDTNFWIYHFEKDERFSRITQGILDFCAEKEIDIVNSVLVVTEFLVKPLREGRKEVVEKFLQGFKQFSMMQFMGIGLDIAVNAAEIRAKYNILVPDAIHLATAIESKADVFISNDDRLKKVKGVKVVNLKKLNCE